MKFSTKGMKFPRKKVIRVIDGKRQTFVNGGSIKEKGKFTMSRAANYDAWYTANKDYINSKRRIRIARSPKRQERINKQRKESYQRCKETLFQNTPEGKLARKLRRNGFSLEDSKRFAKEQLTCESKSQVNPEKENPPLRLQSKNISKKMDCLETSQELST